MQELGLRTKILDAYTKLDLNELLLFLRLRLLSTTGSHHDLAIRLVEYDLTKYNDIGRSQVPPPSIPQPPPTPPLTDDTPNILSNLPIDLLTEILDHLGSWELSKAVGVPTSLPCPSEWSTKATSLDYAILSGSLNQVRQASSAPFTKLGANILVAFDMVSILNYLWGIRTLRPVFQSCFGNDLNLLPGIASANNRPRILEWWYNQEDINPKHYSTDSIDVACRNLSLAALEWWDHKSRACMADPALEHLPFPPYYTQKAMEAASSKAHLAVLTFFVTHGWPLQPGRSLDNASSTGHISVLNWWAYESGLELGKDVKYDKNAVYLASCSGKVEVLQWWKEQSEKSKAGGGTGVQMLFDGDSLVGATRYNRPEVLDWWDKSGLPVNYRICDIEEALEDATGGGREVRKWWARKGVNFKAGDSEWMKVRPLN
ncbi:hypothetical protein Clacol_005769 [Clathrus columnatus]|uniref:F-box domain-containing protein n=1 Tax=Clathrus columnatus TaxID=1419009 RepID=A0AAV5AB17_9AGAM|nr:hypothetical protein Clacol_005769 [Clathrus columnatus]